MSMNIEIFGERTISFTVGGITKSDTQTKYFNVWQTPTLVTYKILAERHPLDAYIEWVGSIRSVEKLPIYAKGDLFCEGAVVGFKDYCAVDKHLKELDSWLIDMSLQGYEIKVEMI